MGRRDQNVLYASVHRIAKLNEKQEIES